MKRQETSTKYLQITLHNTVLTAQVQNLTASKTYIKKYFSSKTDKKTIIKLSVLQKKTFLTFYP